MTRRGKITLLAFVMVFGLITTYQAEATTISLQWYKGYFINTFF